MVREGGKGEKFQGGHLPPYFPRLCQLAFSDVWVDANNNKIALKTYRQPTNTGHYIKWQSFVPQRYKFNLVKNLLFRAYKICNSYFLIHQDFQTVTAMLKKWLSGMVY